MEQLKTIGIFRCTEKQYADSFCNRGSIKFNTPQYWIDLEKEEGKGRGDSMEGVYSSNYVLDINSLLACYKLRKNVTAETINGITYHRSKDILSLPCYCLFGLNNTTFSNVIVDKNGVEHHTASVPKQYFQDFSDNNTKESVKKLPEEKRPVLVMITNPHEFFERVRNYFEKLGVKREEVLIMPVVYMDKNIPFACNQGFPYELFLKDESFLHQSEIRIIINTKNNIIIQKLSEKNNIVDIGDLRDITRVENFYYNDVMMEINGNELLYELPEPIVQNVEDLPKEELFGLIYQISRGEAPGIESEEDIKKAIKSLDEVLRKKHNIYDYEMKRI